MVQKSYLGKIAFVTGGANGIGRTTALAFAQEGASVMLADVSVESSQETVREIATFGGRALAVRCEVFRIAITVAALLGNHPIDVYIFTEASVLKDVVNRVGDLVDNGMENGSFKG